MRRAATQWRGELIILALLLALLLALPGSVPASILPLGLVAAAPLLLSASALLLIYRASGVLNLAQLQLTVLAGVLFEGIVRGRVLLIGANTLCDPCVSVNPGGTAVLINIVIAAVLSVIFAGVFSWLIYLLIMQRFERRPALMGTVVTVFLAQALAALGHTLIEKLVSTDHLKTGQAKDNLEDLPWPGNVSLLGTSVSLWSLLTAGLAVAVVITLTWVINRGRWGLEMRANASDSARARTLGVNSTLVASRAWAWAGLIAGFVGVLGKLSDRRTSVFGEKGSSAVIPQTASTLVVLLAVVAFARFVDLKMAALAALVISVVSVGASVTTGSGAAVQASWVFVLGALMLMQTHPMRTKGRAVREDQSGLMAHTELRPIPPELRGLDQVRSYARLGAIALGVLLLGAPVMMSAGSQSLMIDVFVFGMVAVSLLVLTGWAGQVSLGQFGFTGIGAYVAVASGAPFLLAIPIAALAGAAASVLVGLPALRLRGLHLAISTLAFAVSVQVILFDSRFLGRFLPTQVERPTVLGLDLNDEQLYYYVSLAVLLLVCGCVLGLRRSRLARALIALRVNEAGAQAFGLNPTRVRLTAFCISGAIAATAGAVGAFHYGRLDTSTFAPELSISVFLYTVVGGLGGLTGPLLGTAVYASLNFFFTDNPIVSYVGAGLGAVFVLIAAPGGLAQVAFDARDSLLLRLAYRLRIPVPSMMGDGGVAAALGKAPLDEKRRALVPVGEDPLPHYRPEGQWALDRLGSSDQKSERIGDH